MNSDRKKNSFLILVAEQVRPLAWFTRSQLRSGLKSKTSGRNSMSQSLVKLAFGPLRTQIMSCIWDLELFSFATIYFCC